MSKIKGCLNCKHNISELSDDLKMTFDCQLGHTNRAKQWWKDNGKKIPDDDQFTKLECFEDYEGAGMLDEISKKLDELSDHLNKSDERKSA